MRVEVGPKDMKQNVITVVMRDTGVKKTISIDEHLSENIAEELENMHLRLYNTAMESFRNSVKVARSWNEFMTHLNQGNMVLAPFADIMENEELVKDKSKAESKEDTMLGQTGSAKSLNFPLDEEIEMLNLGVKNGQEMDCFTNELTKKKNKTKEWCLFGRS